MPQQAPNLSREELKLLVEAGDITPHNLGQVGLTKQEKDIALREIMDSGKMEMLGGPMMPPGAAGAFAKAGSGFKKGYDTARASGKAFGGAGKASNVSKASATESLKRGDDMKNVLFGGLNSVKNNYLPVSRGPLQKTDILQMGKNIKETSKAGTSGAVRRRKP